MDKESGFYKLGDIIRTTTGPGILPISASRWYAGVREGEFPQGFRLGGLTVWKKTDIHELEQRILNGELDSSQRSVPKNPAMIRREMAEAS